ncbi:calcium-binding protein [Variovorax rhizosphaerae]|uniref:Calcium-binding protein n=1 Tax=Variovorax rhizosphaerae TaxID=1836200 RepID=A0ABU8WQ30_9BURK
MLPADVLISRSGDNLLLKLSGTTDQVTVTNYFGSDATNGWQIEEIQFADGSLWKIPQVKALVAGALSPTVATPIADQRAVEQSAFDWTIPPNAFKDADSGTALTYTAHLADGSALPSWLGFDAASRRFTGTPGSEALGALQIRVTVTDPQGLSTSDVFALTVDKAAVAAPVAINGTTGADTLTGTPGDDVINGLAGDDKIDGAGGADAMSGGTGNDFYLVDNANDRVIELAGEGVDAVENRVSYALGANLENLHLAGTAAINGTGNAFNNVVTGNTSDNVLDGGAGNDWLYGNAGNDTFIVDSTGDAVVEFQNEGTDTVQSSVTYALGANVENLTLTGTAAINGTGNALDNVLTGNAGNNWLDGGAGNDTYLFGRGDGQDTIGDNDLTAGNVDKIVFKAGVAVADVSVSREGDALILKIAGTTDQVRVQNYFGNDATNGWQIEEIRFTDAPTTVWNVARVKALASESVPAEVVPINGTAGADTLTGTPGDDVINGLAGDDRIDGAGGADAMSGGTGNDFYFVDNANDRVIELAGEGVDAVENRVSYTLGANLENLHLAGTAAINGTGNALNNVVTGNNSDNVLDGGTGNDWLYGNAGNDTYLLARGHGSDVVVEEDGTAGNVDIALFGDDIAMDQLWFAKGTGNDLVVSVIGTEDKFTIKNWYAGNQHHVEQFRTSDGKVLLDTEVQNLVQAMAGFAPPAAAQTTLPASYQPNLNPVIASNWH